MTRNRVSLVALCLAVTVAGTAAQAPGREFPPLILESLTGRDSFEFYCASCHGRTAVGDGPVAAQITTRPADLTTLARRNGGVFPRQRVTAFVDGSTRSSAHGSSDMPLWGRTFRALDSSEVRVKVRLDNLVAYIESLQASPPEGAPGSRTIRPTGAQLFAAHCASCHGPVGRGDGPLLLQLRREPPDLTKLSARNGGAFPSERVRRIVDGRDIPSHGDSEMPVWGVAFARTANREAEVRERIQALVEFLASVQDRAAE